MSESKLGQQQFYWSHPQKFGQGSHLLLHLLKLAQTNPEIMVQHMLTMFLSVHKARQLH
jgi:hypothetical protein